jgi:hypothetical protein
VKISYRRDIERSIFGKITAEDGNGNEEANTSCRR